MTVAVPSASTPAQPKRLVLPEDETGSVGLASDDEEEAEEDDTSDGSSDSDVEGDPSTLVHESLLKSGAKTRVASSHEKPKHAPAEETSGQRDARTLFIGNVAVEVTKSRVRLTSSEYEYACANTPLLAHAKAAQAAYPVFRSFCQDRVCTLPFRRVQKSHIRAPER